MYNLFRKVTLFIYTDGSQYLSVIRAGEYSVWFTTVSKLFDISSQGTVGYFTHNRIMLRK